MTPNKASEFILNFSLGFQPLIPIFKCNAIYLQKFRCVIFDFFFSKNYLPGRAICCRLMSCWSWPSWERQFSWDLNSSLSSEWISSSALWWMISDWKKKIKLYQQPHEKFDTCNVPCMCNITGKITDNEKHIMPLVSVVMLSVRYM